MIAIVDYKAGNLFSVKNALDRLSIPSIITSEINEIKKADKIILPGVGAFKNAIDNLKKYGLDKVIVSEVEFGKPFLGICLGMQLLFNSSEEFGRHEGLNILKGKIIHFNFDYYIKAAHMVRNDSVGVNFRSSHTNTDTFKIPHMGWNSLTNCSGSKLFGDLENQFVYFVHSYHLVTENKDYKQIITNYGYEFCSAIEYKNIFATQFHPEKSGEVGLNILEKFSKI